MTDQQQVTERTGLEIAIIGMAGRFPGAGDGDLERFWENLKEGRESIVFFSDEEMAETGLTEEQLKNPSYVKARAILEGAEYFDSGFFDYTPKEAEVMDPQLRVALECSWNVLEDAGYNPDAYDGSIGYYVGASGNLFWEILQLFSGNTTMSAHVDKESVGNKDYLGMRVSYELNLKGPAITLTTACSSSLVAIDLACKSILTGQCDMALAGGVTVTVPMKRGYIYQEGMVVSPDGHVRPFDAASSGINSGDGVGFVLLKSLEEALADRDNIHAVIKGSAINNDGRRKVGFTAPSVEGQTDVIRAAQHMAEVEPESIGYIEAHGTGTALGDPVEIEALCRAFDTQKTRYCAVGSVKSNLGHLDSAAGVVSLVKTIMAIKNKQIPATINFRKPNPRIDFDNSPFYVNTELKPWTGNGGPRRAGISSFGIGGTNSHIIIEEAPQLQPSGEGRKWKMILQTARTEEALERNTGNLVRHFEKNPGINLADAAYTLQVGRKPFRHRRLLVCSEVREAIDQLSNRDSGKVYTYTLPEAKKPVIFMFSGQGSQYENMGLDLYRDEPAYREELDRCFEILEPIMGYNLKTVLYPGETTEAEQEKRERRGAGGEGVIYRQDISQPLIFSFEYALARLLMKWGVQPRAMIGYSLGEYVSATLAGVFALEDALELVALRGELLHETPGGRMLSVPMTEEQIKPVLDDDISIAVVNGPSCIVSGTGEAVSRFENRLKKDMLICIPLSGIAHAGHSRLIEPMLPELEARLRRVKLNKPEMPYISNVTGNWITEEDAVDPKYWVRQTRETVRFAGGMDELIKEENAIYLEIGPGGDLCATVMQHKDKTDRQLVMNTTRFPQQKVSDSYYFLTRIGRLFLYGKNIDWDAYYETEERSRIPLPGYSFDRKFYSADVSMLRNLEGLKKTGENAAAEAADGGQAAAAPNSKKNDIADWCYVPAWKPVLVKRKQRKPAKTAGNETVYMLYMDEEGLGDILEQKLREEKRTVITVTPGQEYGGNINEGYTVNPIREDDYKTLFQDLKAKGKIPGEILHLGGIGNPRPRETDRQWHRRVRENGFHSLIYQVRAMAPLLLGKKIRVTAVTSNMQAVWGDDLLYPEKAIQQGAVKVIPKEYPNIRTRSIDLHWPGGDSDEERRRRRQREADRLIDELENETGGTGTKDRAFRGNQRFEKTHEPRRLEPDETAGQRLREKGVYLITGGMGGIGLEIAAYLAGEVHARLILTARSEYPPREQWPKLREDPAVSAEMREKIEKLLELEKKGADVTVAAVDVADKDGMKQLVEDVERRCGDINGIIHSAGVADGALIQQITEEQIQRVFNPKINGTRVLDELFRDKPLDYFFLCSSLSSIQAPMGDSAYSAANHYLDAYAHHKNQRQDGQTGMVAVNWDAWQEVGGAVAVIKRLTAGQKTEPGELDHPLLDKRLNPDPETEIYISNLRTDRHWVLDEHRVMGTAILPGTAYLEIIHAAFEPKIRGKALEIENLYLLSPLAVTDEETKEVRTVIKNRGDHYEVTVLSPAGCGQNQWTQHARGNVRITEALTRHHDLKEIEARCNRQEIDAQTDRVEMKQEAVKFGPRWHENHTRIKTGENRGLAYLELPERYEDDMAAYKLHPALMDCALAHYISGGGTYLPFSYKKIVISGNVPRKVAAYIEYKKEGRQEKGFMNSNVTVTDRQGRELVRIEDYALVALQGKPGAAAVDGKKNENEGENGIPQAIAGNRPETIPMPDDLGRGSGEEPGNLLKHGILNTEGVEVFKRVLGVASPQLAISTMDLEKRMQEPQPLDTPPTMETLEAMMKRSKPRYSRPELNIPYVAPRNKMEKILAETWQTFLGIDRVGVHDNFFELGANSLGIIQVNGILKELLKKELTVVTMYAYPTVEQLAAYLEAGDGEDEDALKKEIIRMETASAGRNKLRRRKRNVTGGDHV